MNSTVKLSERMQLIADMVPDGLTVADIGTDHGRIPIYLKQIGRSPKVVLTDIADGPLARAAENIEKNGLSLGSDLILRKGSGLMPIQDGEVQAVIIAGMGGELIADILAAEPDKAKHLEALILQPRSMCEKLRHYLDENGFRIVEEHLVKEGPQIAQLLLAVPQEKLNGRPYQIYENDFDYEFAPLLIRENERDLKEFLKRSIRHAGLVILNLKSAKPDLSREKLRQWESRKAYLEKKLSKI